jgi:hypothetical protein
VGTIDTATGAVNFTTYQLNSATVLTGNPNQPCPRCAVAVGGAACVGSLAAPCTGVCDGSANQGSTCTTRNPDGLTAQCPSPAATPGTQRCYKGPHNNAVCIGGSDCVCHTNGGTPVHTDPAPCVSGLCAQFIGNIPISLGPLTTGTTSKTGLFDNAQCTGAATPQACCTGAGTGNCNTFCPFNPANQTALSLKGAFRTAVCTNSGLPCTVNGDCPGSTCREGTLNNVCQGGTGNGLGCVTAATCGGGTCVKAGTLAQLIRLQGSPAGALSAGVPKPVKLASVFCVPLTTNGTVNGNANLPGPGATTLVGEITLIP